MNKKILFSAAGLLMCAGIIGVGYAAWVITNDASNSTSGKINVEEVVDKRLELTGNYNGLFIEETDSISFGAPETMNGGWLTAMANEDEEIVYEDLTANLGFKVGNYEMCKYVKVSIDLSNELDQAIEAGYITLTTSNTLEFNEEEIASKNGEFAIDIEFDWGTLFENKNPYEYFNAKEVSGTDLIPDDFSNDDVTNNGDYALYLLSEIYKLNDATFTITIEAKVEAPANN